MRELKEELNTSVEEILQHFIDVNQANLYIAYILIYRRKERKEACRRSSPNLASMTSF